MLSAGQSGGDFRFGRSRDQPRNYLDNVDVKDGDTILADCEGKRIEVRLRGIGAPETDQAWGEESEYYLVSLLSDVRYPTTKLIVTSTSGYS